MTEKQDKIFIGTSGWQYGHWQGIFYPENLPTKDWLNYYSQKFQTVEINSSFYHLPRKTTFENWAARVPEKFLFSIKVWRRITHFKKLKNIKKDLKVFFERVLALKEKLGPFLLQFPSNFQAKEENIKRLRQFGQFIREDLRLNLSKFTKCHFALEFRHQSWFNKKVYQILKKYNLALCWADTPYYPYEEIVTADYVYIRLHGHTELYASKYTKKQLKDYAKKIQKLIDQGKTVYVYFDNDAYGHAIENVQELQRLILKYQVLS
ncbi:MAG: DUF72 domain-containing protein [Patescibacteria group bacterium]